MSYVYEVYIYIYGTLVAERVWHTVGVREILGSIPGWGGEAKTYSVVGKLLTTSVSVGTVTKKVVSYP